MAKSKGGVTVSKVWELCEPIVEGLGLSVWDVRYVKEGADWYLRVFIDKPGGIDINDCDKRPARSARPYRKRLLLGGVLPGLRARACARRAL